MAKVDAFGMGGIDLYVSCGKKRYVLKDAIPLLKRPKNPNCGRIQAQRHLRTTSH